MANAPETTLTPTALQELQTMAANWIKAKEVEQQWVAYRKSLEDQMSYLNGGYKTLLDPLETGTTLSKSLKLPGVQVTVGFDLKINQEKAKEFLSCFPHLYGVVLLPEYKPVSSKSILTAIATDTDVGQALREVVSRSAKRPNYAALPA